MVLRNPILPKYPWPNQGADIFFGSLIIYPTDSFFRKLATRRNYVTPPHQSYEELETLYWESMTNDKEYFLDSFRA